MNEKFELNEAELDMIAGGSFLEAIVKTMPHQSSPMHPYGNTSGAVYAQKNELAGACAAGQAEDDGWRSSLW